MDTPLISVVVPVYNVERYLEKCVDSLLKQTYTNLEIILVDDGSKDESGAICDAYSERYPIVKTIHQANGGLSCARNTGTAAANGEYITFVDSDDYVFENYVSCLYSLIEKFGVDMSCARMTYLKQVADQEETVKCYGAKEMLESMCYRTDGIGISACAKLYKKELLMQHPFPQGMLFEDLATTHKIVDAAQRVAISSKQIYYVFQRQGSIRHSPVTEKSLNDGLNAGNELIDFVSTRYPEIRKAAEYRYAVKCMEYLQIFPFHKDPEKEKIIRMELRSHLGGIMKDRKAKKSFKVVYVVSAFSGVLSHIMWKTREMMRTN